MGKTPDKLPAFEAGTGLLRRPEFNPEMPRPITTVAGSLLVVARTVISAIVLFGAATRWNGVLSGLRLASDTLGLDKILAKASDSMLLGVACAVLLADLVLPVLILLGRNWPRVLIMTFVTLDILVAFTAWTSSEQALASGLAFTVLALDILILLALSSHSAAAYARRLEPPNQS